MSGCFAIADPHLSFARPKPMDRFGAAWAGHPEKIARAWRAVVGPGDLVLVGGDISWAMRSAEAEPDLDFLAELPGIKIIGKGNHDYWWPDSAAKLRALEKPGLRFLHNEPIRVGDYAVAGTRLWDFPDCSWTLPPEPAASAAPENPEGAEASLAERPGGAPDPAAMRARELARLRSRLAALDPAAPVRICLLHYPPLGQDGRPGVVTGLLDEFAIDWCVFGHIHGAYPTPPPGASCRIGRTEYRLASVDQINFTPLRLA